MTKPQPPPPKDIAIAKELPSKGSEIKFDLALNWEPANHGKNSEDWSMTGHY